jgi:hypothetical protein
MSRGFARRHRDDTSSRSLSEFQPDDDLEACQDDDVDENNPCDNGFDWCPGPEQDADTIPCVDCYLEAFGVERPDQDGDEDAVDELLTDGGKTLCINCSTPFSRERHEECPNCQNTSFDDLVTDGGRDVDVPATEDLPNQVMINLNREVDKMLWVQLRRAVVQEMDEIRNWQDISRVEILRRIGEAHLGVDWPRDTEVLREKAEEGELLVTDGGWPDGDPCPECGDLMDVGTVGNPGETVSWQECEDCRLGWGPFTGFVDLDEDPDDAQLVADGGRPVHEMDVDAYLNNALVDAQDEQVREHIRRALSRRDVVTSEEVDVDG